MLVNKVLPRILCLPHFLFPLLKISSFDYTHPYPRTIFRTCIHKICVWEIDYTHYHTELQKITVFVFILLLQFINVLQKELDAVEKGREAFISDFSEVRISSFSPLCFLFLFFFIISIYSYYLLALDDLQEDYDEIVSGWKAKLTRSSSGEQRWGLFIAKKKWYLCLTAWANFTSYYVYTSNWWTLLGQLNSVQNFIRIYVNLLYLKFGIYKINMIIFVESLLHRYACLVSNVIMEVSVS